MALSSLKAAKSSLKAAKIWKQQENFRKDWALHSTTFLWNMKKRGSPVIDKAGFDLRDLVESCHGFPTSTRSPHYPHQVSSQVRNIRAQSKNQTLLHRCDVSLPVAPKKFSSCHITYHNQKENMEPVLPGDATAVQILKICTPLGSKVCGYHILCST